MKVSSPRDRRRCGDDLGHAKEICINAGRARLCDTPSSGTMNSMGYEDSFLPNGQPTGTPEQAIDCACGLYLSDPTARPLHG
jgi:hypothetical protein